MAYWLHCQFCGEWSKSSSPLSDDQSCSFCSRPFKAIKSCLKAPAKSLAPEVQDGRKAARKHGIEAAETSGRQEIEVNEVPESAAQTSSTSGENHEASSAMASEATHSQEIPVIPNTEVQVQEAEELESSGEGDVSEALEPDDKPDVVSEIHELPETFQVDEESGAVDEDAPAEPEVISQEGESIPAADEDNAEEIPEPDQIDETGQKEEEEEELKGSEGAGESPQAEMLINFVFENPQTTATPKQLEETTNQEESNTAETLETDEVRNCEENSELPHPEKEPDLFTEAADENENQGDNLERNELNTDEVPMWLDIVDNPETGKIRITFTYGTPRADRKAKEPELTETAESGTILEALEEKTAPETSASLQVKSDSGGEANGIEAGNEEASESTDFSESAETENETVSEEEMKEKQEAPEVQEFSSIELEDAQDESAELELPEDAEDESAVSKLSDDAEDRPAMCEPSDDADSGSERDSSEPPGDAMEPSESTVEERSELVRNEPRPEIKEIDDAESEASEPEPEEKTQAPISRNMPRMTRTYEPYIVMKRRTRNYQQ